MRGCPMLRGTDIGERAYEKVERLQIDVAEEHARADAAERVYNTVSPLREQLATIDAERSAAQKKVRVKVLMCAEIIAAKHP